MERVPILDHGYLMYVEHWGSDERIIEAARMSTGKEFLGWDPGVCPMCGGSKVQTISTALWDEEPEVVFIRGGYMELVGGRSRDAEVTVPCYGCEGKGTIPGDVSLLRRLWMFKHATPFEMGGIVLEVQAPIMVYREWHRHRTQSYNEMSARYTPLPDLNYVPSVERLLVNSKTNKQAGVIKGADELTVEGAEKYRAGLKTMWYLQQQFYVRSLKAGVPKELARIHLGVGRYSRMRASANLRNWLAFLTLRMDVAAQWEIRQYANAVGQIVAKLFPRTWELFAERQSE
jgi:thymidylate synthase (FAD)